MITYAYWIGIVVLAGGAFWVLAALAGLRRTGIAIAIAILAIGAAAYYFRYQQLFVKQYGGVMSVTNKAGRRFLSATWKDEHLWLLTFDPRNDTCYFEEYSKGNLLEGKVTIRNCDPLLPPAIPAP
jgi:hypothetical protein